MTSDKMSRRGLLAGVPAVAVAVASSAATALGGLPAQAADDPIFASIAEYKRADRAGVEASMVFDEAFGKAWKSHGREPLDEGAREAWYERAGVNPLRQRYATAREAYYAACDELGETSPTTVAGAAALLTLYIEDDPQSGERDWYEPALRNLADALQRLAVGTQ
jgi:hypothetical protein